jgi:hypothetical protein
MKNHQDALDMMRLKQKGYTFSSFQEYLDSPMRPNDYVVFPDGTTPEEKEQFIAAMRDRVKQAFDLVFGGEAA